MKQTNRPTFYLDDDKLKPVRAGGVLFYRYDDKNDSYHLLLIYSRDNYEDFGGCSDKKDISIEQMVAREVDEESNGIFGQQFILENIKNANIEPVYIKYCKYVLYFIQINEIYDPEIFGDKEICDDIERKVEWLSYDDFKTKKINFRLNTHEVLNHMKKLFV